MKKELRVIFLTVLLVVSTGLWYQNYLVQKTEKQQQIAAQLRAEKDQEEATARLKQENWEKSVEVCQQKRLELAHNAYPNGRIPIITVDGIEVKPKLVHSRKHNSSSAFFNASPLITAVHFRIGDKKFKPHVRLVKTKTEEYLSVSVPIAQPINFNWEEDPRFGHCNSEGKWELFRPDGITLNGVPLRRY